MESAPTKKISRYRFILTYGLCLALLVFLVKWFQWKFMIADYSVEVYIGLIALLFTALGVWIASQLIKPKVNTVVVKEEVIINTTEPTKINHEEIAKLNLTARELEVLELIGRGKSNTEIAGDLFLSVSTIKTHASNLFIKLDVKSRTQAIEKARRLKITHFL